MYTYQDCIYLEKTWSSVKQEAWFKLKGKSFRGELELPNACGSLLVESAYESIKKQTFTLEFRQGGEVLRLQHNDFHSTLKSLLQENRILPWWRPRIPLLYSGSDLVAVADLWINANWLEQQENSDFKLIWRHRPRIMAEDITSID